MSKEIDDGGNAFPRLYARSDEDGRSGMTMRDWFASQATDKDIVWMMETLLFNHINCDRASARFAFADAMIKARGDKP